MWSIYLPPPPPPGPLRRVSSVSGSKLLGSNFKGINVRHTNGKCHKNQACTSIFGVFWCVIALHSITWETIRSRPTMSYTFQLNRWQVHVWPGSVATSGDVGQQFIPSGDTVGRYHCLDSARVCPWVTFVARRHRSSHDQTPPWGWSPAVYIDSLRPAEAQSAQQPSNQPTSHDQGKVYLNIVFID